jgi:hypothetical protein
LIYFMVIWYTYFVAIWYILWLFVYIFPLLVRCANKSGNPGLRASQKDETDWNGSILSPGSSSDTNRLQCPHWSKNPRNVLQNFFPPISPDDSISGLPDGLFSDQKSQFWFFVGLGMKNLCLIYGHLGIFKSIRFTYFTSIGYILW